MRQTETIEVITDTGNYIVIKQDLDGGFVGSVFVLMLTLTACIAAIIVVWRNL